MIDICSVKKSFGDIRVLNDVNLHIEKGKIFGLVGRSGAGKSTLLRCINGLTGIDEGTISVDGINVTSLSKNDIRALRKDIGMIFQNFSLLNRLSVYDNIALPLRCWKYDASFIDKRVRELLEISGIPEKIKSKPSELSGGQKQRVAIARALTTNPEILLCDEATSALDPQTTKSILSTLIQLNRDLGITIVVVTHEMQVIKSVCEDIAILENGNLEAVGPVTQIFMEQPPALKKLIGERDIKLPESGNNLEIFFTGNNAYEPVITKMARELDIDCTIVWGDMAHYQDTALGSVIINIAEQEYNRVNRFLDSNHVPWRKFDTNGRGKD